MTNPYYFGTVVSVTQKIGWPTYDSEIISGMHQPTLFIVLCQSTVFDLDYTSINGSIARFIASPSNSSTTNVIASTQIHSHISHLSILQRANLDLWDSKAPQELADKFAKTYSQVALAASSGVLAPRPALNAQLRSSSIVAAVPVTPLACLLVANIFVVLLGAILAVLALMKLSGDVGEMQAMLSIDVLVAAHFEQSGNRIAIKRIEDMFLEYQGGDVPRVKVQKTVQDGWRLISH